MEADYVDGEGRPFAVIEFRYRSAAALKSLAILPRSSSPAPIKDVVSEEEVRKIYVSHVQSILRRQKLTEYYSSSEKRLRLSNDTAMTTMLATVTWRWWTRGLRSDVASLTATMKSSCLTECTTQT
jgi:hypothetical protein